MTSTGTQPAKAELTNKEYFRRYLSPGSKLSGYVSHSGRDEVLTPGELANRTWVNLRKRLDCDREGISGEVRHLKTQLLRVEEMSGESLGPVYRGYLLAAREMVQASRKSLHVMHANMVALVKQVEEADRERTRLLGT